MFLHDAYRVRWPLLIPGLPTSRLALPWFLAQVAPRHDLKVAADADTVAEVKSKEGLPLAPRAFETPGIPLAATPTIIVPMRYHSDVQLHPMQSS